MKTLIPLKDEVKRVEVRKYPPYVGSRDILARVMHG